MPIFNGKRPMSLGNIQVGSVMAAHIMQTVWIVRDTDGQYKAVNWKAEVIAFSKYKSSVEGEVRRMSSDKALGIHAIAVVVAPWKRQAKRALPGSRPRRMFTTV